VYAILETNGKAEAVQPGDTVEGGKVVSIAADGLTIKTDDDRLIHVPLSAVSTGSGEGTGGPTGFPGYGDRQALVECLPEWRGFRPTTTSGKTSSLIYD
jgi:hypothetical protein